MLRRVLFLVLACVLVARGLLGAPMALGAAPSASHANAAAQTGPGPVQGARHAAPLAATTHCTPGAPAGDCTGAHAGACAACHAAPGMEPTVAVAPAASAPVRPERAARFASAGVPRTLRPPIG